MKEKAKSIVSLLEDTDKLAKSRSEAKKIHDRISGIGSTSNDKDKPKATPQTIPDKKPLTSTEKPLEKPKEIFQDFSQFNTKVPKPDDSSSNTWIEWSKIQTFPNPFEEKKPSPSKTSPNNPNSFSNPFDDKMPIVDKMMKNEDKMPIVKNDDKKPMFIEKNAKIANCRSATLNVLSEFKLPVNKEMKGSSGIQDLLDFDEPVVKKQEVISEVKGNKEESNEMSIKKNGELWKNDDICKI